jgi:hypothetical protein
MKLSPHPPRTRLRLHLNPSFLFWAVLTALFAFVPALVPSASAAPRYKVLYSFTGGADGGEPAGLIQDAAGNLYGTTGLGGDPNCYGAWGRCGQFARRIQLEHDSEKPGGYSSDRPTSQPPRVSPRQHWQPHIGGHVPQPKWLPDGPGEPAKPRHLTRTQSLRCVRKAERGMPKAQRRRQGHRTRSQVRARQDSPRVARLARCTAGIGDKLVPPRCTGKNNSGHPSPCKRVHDQHLLHQERSG